MSRMRVGGAKPILWAGLAALAIAAQGCPLLSTASEPYKFTVEGTITSIDSNGYTPDGVQVGDPFTAVFIVDMLKPPITAYFIPSFVTATNDPENTLEVRFYHSEYVSSSFDALLATWGVPDQAGHASVATEGKLIVNGKPYIYGQAHASDMSFTSTEAMVKDWAAGTKTAMQFDIRQDPEADDPAASIVSSNTTVTAVEAL